MVFDALHFAYRSQDILRGAYLKVEPGSICGLVGRNGSGKSTLMKIGVGELWPFSGNIFINGQCVTFLRGARRFQHIGYLSQISFLPQELSSIQLLKRCKADGTQYSDELLKSILSQKIVNLSGGENRYRELRLILSLDRQFYLLDEPFMGSSSVLIERMISLLKDKKDAGAGILLTDHYMRYGSQVVDERYELKDGYCHTQKSPVRNGAQTSQ